MREKVIKTMIIVVGLLVICGTVGFGIFSYYYASGTFSMSTTTNYETSFDPQISFDNYGGEFISESQSDVSLECDEEVNVGETATCTGTMQVYNGGTNKIHVEIYEMELDPPSLSTESVYLANQSFTVDEEQFDVESDETQTVNFTVTYTLDYDHNNMVEVDSPQEFREDYSMHANIKVRASEVIDN